MTILPKKKESRKGEEHESEARNRNRNRASREGRCPRPVGLPQQGAGVEADVNHTQNQQIYNNISNCNNSDETVSLPKRVRHNRKFPSSSSLQSPHCSKRNTSAENEEVENEKVDGYNSSDEYVETCGDSKGSALDAVQMEKNFERDLCEKKGFNIKEMATDGACLFRAVADQIYGDQEMHGVVRRHCMDYMVKNRDFFSQYVTEDFNSYIGRKRNEHSHGNHIEMQALSEMYNRPIEVYQYSSEPINTFHSRACNTDDTPPIRLSYHGNVHYNSIIDPYNPTVGVGLGLAGYKPEKEDEHMLNSGMKESEKSLLEQAMLEDKLKATDWEAADEDIAEMVARESYLQWVKDNQKTTLSNEPGGSSAAVASTSAKPRSPPSATKDAPLILTTTITGHPQKLKSPNTRKSPSRQSSPRTSLPSSEAESGEALSPNLPSCSRYPAGGAVASCDEDVVASVVAANCPDWQFSEWDDDGLLAAVLAQSQQDYFQQIQQQQQQSSATSSQHQQQNKEDNDNDNN